MTTDALLKRHKNWISIGFVYIKYSAPWKNKLLKIDCALMNFKSYNSAILDIACCEYVFDVSCDIGDFLHNNKLYANRTYITRELYILILFCYIFSYNRVLNTIDYIDFSHSKPVFKNTLFDHRWWLISSSFPLMLHFWVVYGFHWRNRFSCSALEDNTISQLSIV